MQAILLRQLLQDGEEEEFVSLLLQLDQLQTDLLPLLPSKLVGATTTDVDPANEEAIRRIVLAMDQAREQVVDLLSLRRLVGQDLARNAIGYLAVKRTNDQRQALRTTTA